MKKYLYFGYIFFSILSLFCVFQRISEADVKWNPKSVIWVDISNSMKSKIEDVKNNLRNLDNFSSVKANYIKGFYSKNNDPKPIIVEFPTIYDIKLPENSKNTFCSLDGGLERTLNEIRNDISADGTILLFVTDMIIDVKSENQNFNDISYIFCYEGNKDSNYGIYVIYIVDPDKHNEIKDKKFLDFMDELSGQFEREPNLCKFNYLGNQPIFKVTHPIWEKYSAGSYIDSYYTYEISYIPIHQKLIEGKLSIAKLNPIVINGFSGQYNIAPSDYTAKLAIVKKHISTNNTDSRNIKEDKNYTIIKNLNSENILEPMLFLKIRSPKCSIGDFFSVRTKGEIKGDVELTVSEAVICPPQEYYPNLKITEYLNDSSKCNTLNNFSLPFQYDIRYPSWFWPLRVLFLVLVIFIIVIIRRLLML